MITVYWTSTDDSEELEYSQSTDDPLVAAQVMTLVELYNNTQPAGWSWDTQEEWDRVRAIRNHRDYGVDRRGVTYTGYKWKV